jgi:hypothetical protein
LKLYQLLYRFGQQVYTGLYLRYTGNHIIYAVDEEIYLFLFLHRLVLAGFGLCHFDGLVNRFGSGAGLDYDDSAAGPYRYAEASIFVSKYCHCDFLCGWK